MAFLADYTLKFYL